MATCTSASATVMMHGGSGNHGICTVREQIVGFQGCCELAKSGVRGHGAALDIVKRRRSSGWWDSRSLSAQDRQEPMLHSDDMADPPSHLLEVAAGRIAPRLEKNGVRPFGMCHQIAEKTVSSEDLRFGGSFPGLTDQVGHRGQERLVMEATLGQIRVGAGVEPADPVFFPVFVRDDDHRNRLEPRIVLDVPHELDAVHPGHVDVTHHQIIMGAAHCIPAVDAVDRDVDRISTVFQQLPFELPDRDRIVDDQNPLGRANLLARRLRTASLPSLRPESMLSIERIRSSTSMIKTGQPFSSTDELLILGTLPSRGSSGETRRSRSPRKRSTITPK